ncbi:hypothetical protein Tco_0725102 [Tanacetum coccineum]|uniref:FRIGIDA-like protein n=1 Tax=Tanacetum coccineum TaxID=301880 RepID=A0ABQ4YCU7_9ASTR
MAGSSALMAWSVGSLMTKIENTQANIQSDIASLKKDTSEIKDIMTEIFCTFKGKPFSTPSSSVPKLTLSITRVQATEPEVANVEKVLEHETQDTELIPIIVVRKTTKPTLKPDRVKCIARDTDESLPKLIKALNEVRQDPKALVVIPYEINEVLHHLTNKQIQAHIDKEEKSEKATREARLSKPKMIKDELGPIIPKKKNKVVGELMTSLGKIKRNAQELEPETRIPGLECNRSLPKGVQFVNNQVIEHPKNEIFFIGVFGDEAFQIMSDIHMVDVDTLLSYLVMDSNINTPENQRFYVVVRSLIDSHLDKEKLNSKKVKLEAIGCSLMRCF